MKRSLRTEEKLQVSREIGTLSIDLGNTTTVVAFQAETDQEARLLDLPPITRTQGEIPSLVWFSETNSPSLLIGQEVIASGLAGKNDPNLSRDFKRWIGDPSSSDKKEFGLTPEKAGELLLTAIWEKLPTQLDIRRLVLTTPVESYRTYKSWLHDVCSKLPVDEIALVDEPTAAAMGAGMPPGSKLLVCDFGGSTIDLSLVALEGGEGKASPIAELLKFNGQDLHERSRQVVRCAKVLGKSGIRLGGRDLDRWIANELLPQVTQSENILDGAEKIKCRLSQTDLRDSEQLIEVVEDQKFLKLSREKFQELLVKRNFLTSLENLLKQTLSGGRSNNCDLSDLNGVVAVGGGSKIPLIRTWLIENTKPAPFLTPPPVEAVALGALSLTPGVRIQDVLKKGIFIRCWDKRSEKHFWHPLFLSGQTWPTPEGLEIVLASSQKNQTHIEIVVGETQAEGSHEVIYIDGIPTIESISKEPVLKRLHDIQLSIPLRPPGQPGEDCLRIKFKINDQATLFLEGIDLRTRESIEKQNLTTIT